MTRSWDKSRFGCKSGVSTRVCVQALQLPAFASYELGVIFCTYILILSALLPRTMSAANLKELYRYEGFYVGASAAGLNEGSNGLLYGTTVYGGVNGCGTIFQINTNGALSVLASFAGTNGANPYASLIQASDGNFYGTTSSGGQSDLGTVFQATTNGILKTLFSFSGPDGANPVASLIQASDGNLYGTTSYGGITNTTYRTGMGTVFQIDTNGNFKTLAYFAGTNGIHPCANVIQGFDGYLYGTTVSGGSSNIGTVFQVRATGCLNTIYSFDITHGANPYGGLLQTSNGDLYGTASGGGTKYYQGSLNGTVFKLTTNGAISTVFSFDYDRGASPRAGLVADKSGALYGTTVTGGLASNGLDGDYGTVFKIVNGGISSYSFYGQEGWGPLAGLVKAKDGNYYGTTFNGSSCMVYRFRTNTGAITMITYLPQTNGSGPQSGLLQGSDGSLYGLTSGGGPFGRGTFYSLTTNNILTTLAVFSGSFDDYPSGGVVQGNDGSFFGMSKSGNVFRVTTNGVIKKLAYIPSSSQPNIGLTLGPDGALYGTTRQGGANYYFGSIFRITTNGNFSTFYSFDGSIAYPGAGLLLAPDGNFYGTTPNSVFKCTTNGVLSTVLTIASNSIYQGAPGFSNLTLGDNGRFYAMTAYGGNASSGPNSGYGTVIQISTNGSYLPLILFNGTNGLNRVAVQAPVVGADGALYGITPYGGTGFNGHPSSGKGTVYRLTTNGIISSLIVFDANIKISGSLSVGGDGRIYCVGYTGGAGNSGGSVFLLDLSNEMLPLIPNMDGLVIRFSGLPNNSYRLLRASGPSGPWRTLSTLTAGSEGTVEYIDNDRLQNGAFYKTISP